MPSLTLMLALAALALATPAWAAPDETPGGSAAVGFPIVLVVLAVVASAFAIVWKLVSQRKQRR